MTQTVDLRIPRTHKAAVAKRVGEYPQILDIETPSPESIGPGKALVKIEYSGVCHSDISLSMGKGTARPVEPIISGHEGAGYVVALGPPITTRPPFAIGDRVGVKFVAETCMNCEACEAGEEQVCTDFRASGIHIPGTFQQYVIASTLHLTPIPDEIPLEVAAPILCAGLTVYKALLTANLRPGDWVVIPGAAGGLGHLGVQYAKAMNYRVIGIDTGEEKRALVQRCGADVWIDFRVEKDITAKVLEMTEGKGAHAAVVTAGSIQPYQQALTYLRPRATLVCLGLPPSSSLLSVSVSHLVITATKIIGSTVGSRREAKEALGFVGRGRVRLEYEVRGLADVKEIYKEIEAGKTAGKIVLKLN